MAPLPNLGHNSLSKSSDSFFTMKECRVAPYFSLAYIGIFALIEVFALVFGQKWQSSLLNIICFVFVLITFSSNRNVFWIFALLLGTIETCDVVSFFSFEREADTSFLAIFRWEDVGQIPWWLFLAVAGTILAYIISVFYPWTLKHVTISTPFYIGMFYLSCIVFTFWLKYHFHVMFPFTELTEATIKPNSKLHQYFTTKPQVLSNGTGKNLIITMLEGMELEFIGKYSTSCPGNTPFLERLATDYFFNENVITQKYVDYTAGGIFAQTCGLPLIRARTGVVQGATPIHTDTYKCIGHFLREAGYYTEVHTAGHTSQHLDVALEKQFQSYVEDDVHMNDYALFEYLKNTTLPNLMSQPKPWALFVHTINAHLFDNIVESDHCTVNEECPPAHQSQHCTSTMYERFLKHAESIGALNNTEIVIFGDHRHVGLRGLTNQYKMKRKMGFWIPTRPKSDSLISKPASPYDTAPTVLDLLEIKYKPEFPWGKSLMSNEIGDYPTNEDFAALYNYWSQIIDLPFDMLQEVGWKHALV